MKILIDADACPRAVLEACLAAGEKYSIPVWTVASFNHVIQSDCHFVVGDAPDEADIKVANLAEKGDVVVTQDFGLAALLLGKGVVVISPAGRRYDSEKIAFLLEERAVKARFRRGGGRTPGPSKRTPDDDRRFTDCLLQALTRTNEL